MPAIEATSLVNNFPRYLPKFLLINISRIYQNKFNIELKQVWKSALQDPAMGVVYEGGVGEWVGKEVSYLDTPESKNKPGGIGKDSVVDVGVLDLPDVVMVLTVA